jgi:hypothetical protein
MKHTGHCTFLYNFLEVPVLIPRGALLLLIVFRIIGATPLTRSFLEQTVHAQMTFLVVGRNGKGLREEANVLSFYTHNCSSAKEVDFAY